MPNLPLKADRLIFLDFPRCNELACTIKDHKSRLVKFVSAFCHKRPCWPEAEQRPPAVRHTRRGQLQPSFQCFPIFSTLFKTFFNLFNMVKSFFTKGSLLAGYLELYFAKQRGGLDPLSLNDQEKGTPPPPPPSKGTLAICLVSLFTQQPLRSVSSSSPSASTSSLSSSSSSSPSSFDLNSDFSTSIFQVPNGAMKVTGSSIHRYRKKRHWSLC